MVRLYLAVIGISVAGVFTAAVRGADGLAVMEYEICVEEDAVKKEKSR